MRSIIAVLVAILSVALLIYGIILRGTLQNGSECDMTWSVVKFILLPQLVDEKSHVHSKHLPYRLLKFTDGRDRRYEHLIDYKNPVDDKTDQAKPNENWCQTGNAQQRRPGHIVLYVPGHEGQYMQARSVGAHGINLTRRSIPQRDVRESVTKMWNGTMNARAGNVEDFLYDVYTVDFNGEGGGFHGSRLFAQAEFVSRSIERIQEQCGEYMDGITVVAHSIGGLVSRKAVLEVNERRLSNGQEPLVRNLITLASPHSFIPLVFEPSVIRFQYALAAQETIDKKEGRDSSFTLVSISGGLRDELIPPSSCDGGNDHSISVMVSDIIPSRVETGFTGQKFGMDHKAIVWCSGVLSVVREMIHEMVVPSSNSAANRFENMSRFVNEKRLSAGSSNNDCDFQCQILEKDLLLEKEYGFVGAFAIKTSMIYNCRVLAMLYAMNGIMHFVCMIYSTRRVHRSDHGNWYLIIPPLSSMLLIFASGEASLGVGPTVIVAFTAMNIYFGILYGVIPSASWILKRFVCRDLMQAPNVCSTLSPSKQGSKARGNELSRAMKVYIIQQLWLALVLSIIACLSMAVFSAIRKNAMVRNITSIGALVFLMFLALLYINILHLGCWPKGDIHQLKYRRNLAAILLVIFPLFTIGKIAFALSLLTNGGQASAVPYKNFEQLEWERFCNPNNGLVCTICGWFLKYDLIRYVSLVCIPTYIVLFWMNCRRDATWSVAKKEH